MHPSIQPCFPCFYGCRFQDQLFASSRLTVVNRVVPVTLVWKGLCVDVMTPQNVVPSGPPPPAPGANGTPAATPAAGTNDVKAYVGTPSLMTTPVPPQAKAKVGGLGVPVLMSEH